jgi:prepilin-type N-terminal cleavage/methylation domain-containing protein
MPVIAAARRRLSAEGGFTLIELLVGMSIGLIVLFALYGLLDQVGPATARVTDRIDAQARGRAATEQMARLFRTTVCVQRGVDPLTDAPLFWTPYAYGDDSKVTFYTDTVADTTAVSSGTFVPEKRQLAYAGGKITESTWTVDMTPLNNTPPTVPIIGATPVTRTLATDVQPIPGKPVFTYKGFSGTPATLGTLTPANDGTGVVRILDVDLPKVARIDVAFRAVPNNGRNATAAASFEDSFNTRPATDLSTDTTANKGPQCQI